MWPFTPKLPTTGLIPNPEQDKDPRNLAYDEMMVFGGDIPKEGSVIARPIEVLNQGQVSSCTTHSSVGAIHQTTGRLLSPRWAYKRIKTDKKYPSSNLPYGAYMRDSIAVFVNEGSPDLELLPNNGIGSVEDYFDFVDTVEMHENARSHAGGSYVYATLAQGSTAVFDSVVKYMWEQKRPVKVGVSWYSEYNNARSSGVIPAQFPKGPWSGHDMCAVAWKEIDGEPYLGFIQSWGKYWGNGGMCWMPRNFSTFFSPIAYVPPIKEPDLHIKKPLWPITRNLHKERANAQELTALVDIKFPMVGNTKANGMNAVARSIFGQEKLVFVNACAYLGWKFTDVINHLYARSRGKTDTEAFNLNFSITRKEYFSK